MDFVRERERAIADCGHKKRTLELNHNCNLLIFFLLSMLVVF